MTVGLPSRLAALLAKAERSKPLAPLTTWGIGGPAEYLLAPKTPTEAAAVLAAAREAGWPVFFLGRGSNVLIADAGLPGITLHLAKFCQEITFAPGSVTVGAGVFLPRLAALLAQQGWRGYEFLIGIPGTVGAAVRLNAGTGPGQEMAQRVLEVTVLTDDLQIRTLSVRDLCFGYRTSLLLQRPRWLILAATLRLAAQAESAAIQARQRAIIQNRRARFPAEKLTCGSVFKNPPGGPPAGWLIEHCGFKGKAIGDAQVSTKHANFIINRGRATAAQMQALMQAIQERVWREYGIALEREVVCLPG
ncbi:MAG: UDP-N-acetylmuramate dehydrogenase [Desulfobacca sp.]|uniref:UDP-N-acetylmuramate dehydrogenase n=1 Tax=Desulfobacca sp. TaxID=2067990 RepID=UPI004049BE31